MCKLKTLSSTNKINKIQGPLMASFCFQSSKLSGKAANKTLEPSSGGIGIRLKIPKIKLIITK